MAWILLAAAACEDLFMSSAINLHKVADDLGMLVPIPKRVASCISTLPSFLIIQISRAEPNYPVPRANTGQRLLESTLTQ